MGLTAEREGPISQIQDWHRAIIRYSVMGMRPSEIAKTIGMTEAHVSLVLGSPLVIKEKERLLTLADYNAVEVATELRMRQGRAIEAIDRGLDSEDEKLAVSTGFEILDRTGYGKTVEPQKHLHLHAHKEIKEMSDEELLDDVMSFVEDKER